MEIDFHTKIEEGDIELSEEIQYAYLLMGNTKRGKTTLGYHLSHLSLIGDYINTNVSYKAQKQNLSAKIGEGALSQTIIPNFFKTNSQKKIIIDCPGFGDTGGASKLLTNAYFNYRVFSKVKNVKFILVVTEADVTDAKGLTETIKFFLDNFVDFDKVKEKILKSMVIIVTKTEKSVKNIKDILNYHIKQLKPLMKERYIQWFMEILKSFVQKDHIFVFKQAQLNIKNDTNNNLLQKIDQKADVWWSRVKTDEGYEMKDLNIKIKQLLQQRILDQKFKNNYENILINYQKRIQIFFHEFELIIKQLINDSLKGSQSHEFINKIQKFVENYYNFKNQQEINKKRLKLQQKLFNIQLQKPKRFIQGKKSERYWFKKIEVCKKIFEIIDQANISELGLEVPRDQKKEMIMKKIQKYIKQFKTQHNRKGKIEKFLHKIKKQFTNIGLKQNSQFKDLFEGMQTFIQNLTIQKNTQQHRQQFIYQIQQQISSIGFYQEQKFTNEQKNKNFIKGIQNVLETIFEKIYELCWNKSNLVLFSQYRYLMHRIIVELKIINIVVTSESKNDSIMAKFPNYFTIREYFQSLWTNTTEVPDYFTAVMKFGLKLPIEKNKSFHFYTIVDNFLDMMKQYEPIQEKESKQRLDFQMKKAQLVIVAYQALKVNITTNKETGKTFCQKFYCSISFLEEFFKLDTEQKIINQSNYTFLRKMYRYLAEVLFVFQQYQSAIEAYQCILQVDKAILVYKAWLSKQQTQQDKKRILIRFGEYCSSHGLSQLAMQKYQEAFTLTSQFLQAQQLGDKILHLSVAKNNAKQYYRRLLKKNLILPLPLSVKNFLVDFGQLALPTFIIEKSESMQNTMSPRSPRARSPAYNDSLNKVISGK